MMKEKLKFIFFILFVTVLFLIGFRYVQTHDIAVLNPKGMIALKERNLLNVVTLLMLIVVVPVFILTAYISWVYRQSNKKAKYSPKWDHNLKAEFIWWGIPFLIIVVIGVLTWKGCWELDPFKPLDHPKKPLKIQVVALQWKWLFIYPEQEIATVNDLRFPEKTPLYFEITADAPMNSFWIPQLGGQIYAMPGMRTKLYLIADEPGLYRGSSANLSGRGFASMNFTAQAMGEEDFENWVKSAKASDLQLNQTQYEQISQESIGYPQTDYQLDDRALFDRIVMKYMTMAPEKAP